MADKFNVRKIFQLKGCKMNNVSCGINIPKNDLVKSKVIGEGSNSTVYIGKWNGVKVAIKMNALPVLPDQCRSDLVQYAQASHPNIVQYFGYCDHPGKFCLVEELMFTNLTNYLIKNELSLAMKAHIGKGVALGLNFLHNSSIAHKHLKSNNIFLTKDLVVKITDFGQSKIKLERAGWAENGSRMEASIRWRAPECFTREYSKVKDSLEAQKATDVYAYGLILWQFSERKIPFSTYSESEVVQKLCMAEREVISRKCPKSMAMLIRDCWSFTPADRPTTGQILSRWKKIKQEERKISVACLMRSPGNVFSAAGMKDIVVGRIFPLLDHVSAKSTSSK